MKRIICIFVIAFIIIAGLAAQEDDKPIITVLDFTTEDVSKSEMRSIINVLSSNLFKTDAFTVIDVSQREMILEEMEFSMSGCTDESCMLEVGRMLAAEAIVVGNLGKVGSRYVLTIKMLETETGRTLQSTDGRYANLDDLLDGVTILAYELAEKEPPEDLSPPAVAAEPEPTVPEPAAPVRKKEKSIGVLDIFMIGSGAFLGVGGGVWMLLDYLDVNNAYDEYMAVGEGESEETYTEAYDNYTSLFNNYQENNRWHYITMGTGAALLAGGVIMALLPAKDEKQDVSLIFSPGPAPVVGVRFVY